MDEEVQVPHEGGPDEAGIGEDDAPVREIRFGEDDDGA